MTPSESAVARAAAGLAATVGYLGRLARGTFRHPIAMLRRAAGFPARVAEMRRIVREALEPAALDEALWSFRGFHTAWADPHYRARTWDRVRLASVSKADVVGIEIDEIVGIMRIAMEIEDPIPLYSRQSGEGFRFLLPNLARYMGKNEEQADYAARHGLPWCESSWCEEEKRHAPAFARAIAHLTGEPPDRSKPNEVAAVTSSESDALHHLVRRQSTEWGSSGTYVFLAAHARGELRRLFMNLALDEIKHLAITSAADVYLLGPRPFRRLADIARVMAHYTHHHEGHRSTGSTLSGNVFTIGGITLAMLLEERHLRRWLRTLPLATLREIFEVPSTLPVIAAFEPDAEGKRENDRRLALEASRRASLERWSPREAARARRLAEIEERHGAVLDRIVRSQLGGFRDAPDAGSERDRALRGRIARATLSAIPPDDREDARAALIARLRDSQIRNNRYVRSLLPSLAETLERVDRPSSRTPVPSAARVRKTAG